MSETFPDWLARNMKRIGVNQRTLAKRIDVSPSAVNRWTKEMGRPDTVRCAKLASVFGLPLEQVYRVAGYPVEETEGSAPEPPRSFTQRMREAVADLMADPPIEIPIHQQVASAGMGDEILEYVYWSAPRAAGRNIVGLKVHGNSMEPEIQDGDVIFVDKDLAPHVGSMVIAYIGNVLLVKWFRKDRNGNPVLVGNNGEMSAQQAKIDGVVISSSRDWR